MSLRTPTILALGLCTSVAGLARAADDVAGTLVTYKQNAGWCWFQDPRAVYANGHLVIGSIAGTTGNGSNAGDANATTYTLGTGASSTTLLHAALGQDDHDAPAFALLPDGRVLATYEQHGGTNNVYWRTTTSAGNANTWGAETTSVVNVTNDGNGNTYNNPYYLSVPGKVYDFSRAIGYDPNYSTFTPATTAGGTPTFAYGGHFLYWKNPNLSGKGPNGGNGRPYMKYTSNGTDTIWFAATEDSPDNYWNSLYSGYIKFTAGGVGTVYTSTGTALGGLATGTGPTTATANSGSVASGTGFSFNPTQFTPVFKAANDGSLVASWASDMHLDPVGHPYLVMTARADNPSDGSTALNTMRYYYSHFDGTAWKTSFLAYGGNRLYAGQNNYSGLAAADPSAADIVYISSDVDPSTGAVVLSDADGKQHFEIYQGTTTDDGNSWVWLALTSDSTVDNLRPVATAISSSLTSLIWMRGTYTSYTNYNTNLVGLTINVPEPTTLALLALGLVSRRRRSRGVENASAV